MPGFDSTRWLVLVVCGALAMVGCATDTQGETGSLSLDLVINGDTEIDQVQWTISCGGEQVKAGTINTSANGATASVEAYGLEPGACTIMMEAVSTDGETTCKGETTFDIVVGQVTEIHVVMNCKLPPQFGGVRVDGEFNICPYITWADASPLTTSVGNNIDLFAMATDDEGDAITYMWSSGSGTIANPMAASTTYTCTEVGADTITILVTDDEGTYCMDMHDFPITCVAGDGNPCDGVICDDTGNECTVAACNPANGMCETSNVTDGTDCDGGAGMCMAGTCVDKDLCMDVVCDDTGNECTAAVCNPATGMCETSNVADGTSCGDGGACMGGTCIEEDLCIDVVCDDTMNECTVEVCNSQTGMCDVMNVMDGTACLDNTGTCMAGMCEVGNLCDGVECTSANDCIDPGTCNPSNGMCEGGGPLPLDTICAGGFCDGAGACVACNDGNQCPDDTNACTMAACDMNMCGQANVMNGMTCDLVGMDDGMCEDGTCVAVPACTPATADVDCDDGDLCTINTCPDGMCVSAPAADGTTCDANGISGACQGGVCLSNCDTSVVDCVDTGANAECTEDLCNPATSPGTCSNPPIPDCTSCCDSGGGADSGNCTDGVCEAPAPVSFAADILPYFGPGLADCVECHTTGNAPKGVAFDSYANILAGGANGPLVVPGDSADPSALLIPRLNSNHNNGPDDAGFVVILSQWIDEGALDN